MSDATRPLQTIEQGTSAEVIAKLIPVAFPDARTVLDATFGNGAFWKGTTLAQALTGMDLNPERARDIVGDFRALPFADFSFDLVVFDPPFQTDMGRGKASFMGARFGTFDTIPELREAVEQGVHECWRVARLGIVVKVQDYIHNNRAQWMSRWVDAALAPVEPYDVVYLQQPRKLIDPKWLQASPLSVRRNHATFWVYRRDPMHRRRPQTPQQERWSA